MPTLSYQGVMPTPEQFQADLAHAFANANPIDDLIELTRELHDFEQKYNMTSEDFYKGYQAGALDDELQHCLEWVAAYDAFVETKRLLEVTLIRAAIQPVFDKMPA